MKAGKLIIETGIDNKNFDKQIESTKYKLEQLEEEFETLKKAEPYSGQEKDLQDLSTQIEKTKNNLADLIKKQNKMNEEGFKETSVSLGDVIKKVGKWSLALFGVRSAYSAIRSAMSLLSSQNEQMASDIQYIKTALATVLEPIIEKIISLVFTLLQIIQKIIFSITGKNIFADANKNLKSANKQAKELQKTMLGFDTANILGSAGTGGTGTGVISPSVDLSQITDIDLKQIGAIGDKIKEIFDNTFTSIIKNIQKVLKESTGLSDKSIELFGNVAFNIKDSFLGIIDAIFGTAEAIFGLLSGDTDAFKRGIEKAFIGIKDTFKNVLDGMGNLSKLGGSIIEDFLINPLRNAINSLPDFVKKPLKAVINFLITCLNHAINGINKLFSFEIPWFVPEFGGKRIGMSIPQIPKLAVGGIVNMPGRGVMYGGANIAEQGAEGVIPLTNDQSLQMIADAIAQKMNVTLDITNKIDGRVLNRQLEQVRARNNFARNGV